MPVVGQNIGQIRILQVLGKGGMGEVYVGFDETLERRVAVKAIRAGHRLRAQAKARFLREARLLAKLEHPDVCKVHGFIEHEEGDFLVLELVDGVTMTRAMEDGLDAAARMSIAIRIVGVLREAHAAGIVHRDLKPDNVMVTPDRGVKVLDFGLARLAEIETRAADPQSEEPITATAGSDETLEYSDAPTIAMTPSAGRPTHTVEGAILGTPAFMSPEQARGEPVTTAGDMYSLGLLLQWLFTGRRPFERGLGAAGLVRRAARAETLPVTGIDPDLKTLIERLKAAAPAARATAIETLERLKWIRDKPRRRLRRFGVAALLVVVAAAGLKYTLDLRRERAIAVEAQQIANQRRAQAEGLIEFMIGDLRGKLEPLGKLDILDDVGTKALDYFASVPEAELSDEELATRSMTLYQLGQVRMLQGNLHEAARAFVESANLARSLTDRDPDNLDRWMTLGNAHFYLASIHWSRGELDEALREFEAYRAIGERLARADPRNPTYRMEQAFGEGGVARVLEAQGELDRARSHMETLLDIVGRLVQEHPDRHDWRLELATGHVATGSVLESLGDLSGAEEQFRSAIGLLDQLLLHDPEHMGYAELLVTTHAYLGSVLEHRGEHERAAEHYRNSFRTAERLVATDPSNAYWKDLLSIGHKNLGRTVALQGDVTTGRSHLLKAYDTFSDLVALEPEKTRWRRQLASVSFELGTVLFADGKFASAAARSAEAGRILSELEQEGASDPVTRLWVCDNALLRGRIAQAQGSERGAQAAWEDAHESIQKIAEGSRDGRVLAPLALTLAHLGRVAEAREIVADLRDRGYVDPRIEAMFSGH